MPNIAPGSDYRCTERAVSIVRAALGYPAELPLDWSPAIRLDTGLWMPDLFRLLRKAFPGREVKIYCADSQPAPVLNQPGVHKLSTLTLDDVNNDDNLWIFAYTTESTNESHAVIGIPVTYGGELQVRWAASISIEEANHGH